MSADSDKTQAHQCIALFRNQKFDFATVFARLDDDENYRPSEEYIRLSKWMPVEFDLLPPAELAGAELESLAELRRKTVEEFKEKLRFIDERVANVRALTGPEASS